MKTFLKIIAGLLLVLLLVYFLGPRIDAPILDLEKSSIPSNDLLSLEKWIADGEAAVLKLKNNNEAKIIWANDNKTKTEYSFVYLHGFSASHEEGNSLHRSLASAFGGNLYLSRLYDHGTENGTAMHNMDANKLLQSAADAIEIGKQLGEKVVVLSCSTGSTLALYLAGDDPAIEALLCYSPNIDIFDKNAALLTGPWGVKMGELVTGDKNHTWVPDYEEGYDYWTTSYPVRAIAVLKSLIDKTMTESTFGKIKQPVFVSYWPGDDVVSIPRIKEMFEQLGGHSKNKLLEVENAGSHMMISDIMVEDNTLTFFESSEFLERIGLKKQAPKVVEETVVDEHAGHNH